MATLSRGRDPRSPQRTPRDLGVDLALNEAQLIVLKGIIDGPDLENPPNPSFQTSAISLRSRGLIEL